MANECKVCGVPNGEHDVALHDRVRRMAQKAREDYERGVTGGVASVQHRHDVNCAERSSGGTTCKVTGEDLRSDIVGDFDTDDVDDGEDLA